MAAGGCRAGCHCRNVNKRGGDPTSTDVHKIDQIGRVGALGAGCRSGSDGLWWVVCGWHGPCCGSRGGATTNGPDATSPQLSVKTRGGGKLGGGPAPDSFL